MAERDRAEREEERGSVEAGRRQWERWCKLPVEQRQRVCANCVHVIWPVRYERVPWKIARQWRYPICVNQADAPGEPREVHPVGVCRNYRAKRKPVLRGKPPEPRAGEKYIPLTRGLWAIVSEQDYEWLSQYRWYASPGRGGQMYARRSTGHGTVSMHREIMNPPEGKCVDHKNHIGLDNRRQNLRNCTVAENQYNRVPQGGKSRYKGVYPAGDKWMAIVKHKGRSHYFGTFDDEAEAARVRDRKAYELQGEFAYLNFPDEIDPAGKGRTPKPPRKKDIRGNSRGRNSRRA